MAASTFYKTAGQEFIPFILTIAAYGMFYIYFFKCFTEEFEQKLLQAEKKLGNLDRVLEKEVRKRTFEIEQVNRKLVDISRTDPLSKLLTNYAITDIMESLINKKIKEFAVLMFDVDNFKDINDNYGHIVGDKCIKRLALIAKGAVRDIDHVGRYGGDEFVIILPSLDSAQSYIVAERLRKKAEESNDPHFTVSIGISVYPTDGLTPKELIAAADKGMYLSKKSGKNMVSYSSHQR
jgi:diguanylate cyclase (GGDEF)-like protein